MKNAGKHADTLKGLLKKVPKELRNAQRPQMELSEAVVRASLLFDATDGQCETAIETLRGEYADFNELRVATELEVQDLVGIEYPKIDERTTILRSTLHGIFESENSFKIDRLKELKRAEIREFLHDLTGITPFVEAYVMMMTFDGTAFPVDEATVAWLVDEEVLEGETSIEDAQTFLESHVRADDCYPFFLFV
ncbi:MAG TPA: hypothetical protein PK402_05185, partial [Tepidisphaeraceae bacterium]|nr:hypothetical protein [Tepidisphaeraceae bacterium]